MNRSLLIALGAIVALLLPTAAEAKGPLAATISGPGLSAPIQIRGNGEGDTSSDLGVLVTEGGFFPQAFGQSPDPLLKSKPTVLGSRYTVVYVVPGPTTDTLRQNLYPYAARGPVTYMAPGQRFWGNQVTPGGWYRGVVASSLRAMLIRAGLPAADPSPPHKRSRAASGYSRVRVAIGTGAGLVFAGGALVLLRRRR
jgi:hypothetical protein